MTHHRELRAVKTSCGAMRRTLARLRVGWRLLRDGSRLNADMRDEMRFHIDMEAERLAREQGLSRDEAERRAAVAFGGVEKYRQRGREALGLQWVDAVSADAKLGVRMLLKYRGLTVAGGFAMAVAIAISAAGFEALSEVLTPTLPFDPEARVISLQIPGPDARVERRVLHAFVELRERLVSIEQLGAWRTVQRNVITDGPPPAPIKVAEMSASGFVIARTPPLMGRSLGSDDERDGAAPVLVVGYDPWQSRFAADPRIVGRTMNLGGVPHTIVGVMPEGFRFPHSHDFWVPLRANPLEFERGQGPSLYLFGRLAPGVALQQAQAEFATFAQHVAAADDRAQSRLLPRVLPYTREHVDLDQPALVMILRIAQLLVGAAALLVAVNIAVLFYARTVTRLGEIGVRTALGASRGRILSQLFVEALALSLVGAAIGLGLAGLALRAIQTVARGNGSVPFWIQFELSPSTALYAFALAVVAAAIMGVVPGLKATGHGVTASIQEITGRSGTRLGPVWTSLVVAQVAVAVAVLPVAAYLSWQVIRLEVSGPGFAAERFVVGSVVLGDEMTHPEAAVVRARQAALATRLAAEPGVSAVTFSSAVPGFAGSRRFEFDERVPVIDASDLEASTLDVSVDLFDTYDAAIIAGRSLTARDTGQGGAVVVNETFASVYLRGRSPLGVQFRYAPSRRVFDPRPWHEIVGVVRNFPSFPPSLSVDGEPVIYHAAAPGDIHPFVLSVRYAGEIPPNTADRFRTIAAEVDPSIELRRVARLSQFYEDLRSFWHYVAWALGFITTSVLLLSAAGIYAMMSFVVAQRTREIGIRTALGAHPRRILRGVFGRAASQLGLGLVIGSLLSGAAVASAGLGIANGLALVGSVAALMLAVGLLATLGPARRSLRIQANAALRADG